MEPLDQTEDVFIRELRSAISRVQQDLLDAGGPLRTTTAETIWERWSQDIERDAVNMVIRNTNGTIRRLRRHDQAAWHEQQMKAHLSTD